MASLIGKGGRWSLQFRVSPRSERQTVALGAMSEAQARAHQERVEALVRAIRAGSPPDPSTGKWAAELSDFLYAKLAKAGLVTPRDHADERPGAPLLGRFLDGYIAKRTDAKPSTKDAWGCTRRCLVDYFGATRPLDKITPGDCDDFRRWLATDQKLADNTVRRRCGFAKQFFRAAIRCRLIAENPFADMAGCMVQANHARDRFITRQEAAAVLEACPDAQWRLLFALSRYGGMRCPSEHMALRWGHVDWERSRITVTSPKTEHHAGKGTRVIPIFPELRPFLEAVWEQAEPGTEFVILHPRGEELHSRLERIVRRAGLEPWPKLWQNLRATRATELISEGWPEFKVCAWLGHTKAIAEKHYWQVTDDDFRKAAGLPALQMALQTNHATPCNPVRGDLGPIDGSLAVAPSCTDSPETGLQCTSARSVTP